MPFRHARHSDGFELFQKYAPFAVASKNSGLTRDLRVLFASGVCIGPKIANQRNTYEIEVGFFYHLLDANV